MRAVKGRLGHSLELRLANWKALARAKGTSRRASGWAGEKAARSGDQSAPIPEEITSERGRIYRFYLNLLRKCQRQGRNPIGQDSSATVWP
jgi:hypothetical protein